jgi:hypothetical protein
MHRNSPADFIGTTRLVKNSRCSSLKVKMSTLSQSPRSSTESDSKLSLKLAEQNIEQNVLHVMSKKKERRFKRTIMAVHAIVSQKLYKAKASSLEVYFKDSWNISRAQVYRFLDCAWVLKVLFPLLILANGRLS